MNIDDTFEQGKKYVDDRRYGNAIRLIDRLTTKGNHKGAIQIANYLCEKRGNPTDWGILAKACRRSSHDVRLQEYPKVIESVEEWLQGESYVYRVQTIASLLTLLRLMDDRKRFWEVYNNRVENADKHENEFILAEYAQMLRQDDKDRYIDEWINIYKSLPEKLKKNDLLRKLNAQALLDQGTTPLEDVEVILKECRNEQFKDDLLQRIDTLKQLRGKTPFLNESMERVEREAMEQPLFKGEKVFISYSRVDEKLANSLVYLLEEIGIECFLDQKDIDWGSSITYEIHKGLSECSAVVVIISPASLKSQWVPYEIGRAVGEGKRILPLLTHPSLELPGYMRDLHYKTDLKDVKTYFEQLFKSSNRDGKKD
ncbi:MAG: toll/interleukin-1 receptor domain-containing protein [Candidatus Hodarchaeales archaeon]